MRNMKASLCILVTSFVITGLFLQPSVIARHTQPNRISIITQTGSDGLKGGPSGNRVNLVVFLRAGTFLRFNNINQSQDWGAYSTHFVAKELPDNLTFEDITSVRLEAVGRQLSPDNWNLNRLSVSALIGNQERHLYQESGDPLVEFNTRDRPVYYFYITSPPPTLLSVEFRTGSDDLRGGNDNVNLIVLLRPGAGPSIRFNNVNQGRGWAGNSLHVVYRHLPSALTRSDIIGVQIETTFRGGIAGDNWNLNGLAVNVEFPRIGPHIWQPYRNSGNPLVRFTGEKRSHVFGFRTLRYPPAPPIVWTKFSENKGGSLQPHFSSRETVNRLQSFIVE